MHDSAIELGVDYSHMADSAYPHRRCMEAILKCPQGGQLTAQQCRFNALMARFSIIIENLFTEVD